MGPVGKVPAMALECRYKYCVICVRLLSGGGEVKGERAWDVEGTAREGESFQTRVQMAACGSSAEMAGSIIELKMDESGSKYRFGLVVLVHFIRELFYI